MGVFNHRWITYRVGVFLIEDGRDLHRVAEGDEYRLDKKNRGTIREVASWVNSIMGRSVITEEQLSKIIGEARRAHERGGMEAVFDYLLRVTQADVDRDSLRGFAEQVRRDPQKGVSMVKRQQQQQRSGGGSRGWMASSEWGDFEGSKKMTLFSRGSRGGVIFTSLNIKSNRAGAVSEQVCVPS